MDPMIDYWTEIARMADAMENGEPSMCRIAPEPQLENLEEPGNISSIEDFLLQLEPLSTAGRTFNPNSSDLESPLLDAEPLSMAIVPLNNNNTDNKPEPQPENLEEPGNISSIEDFLLQLEPLSMAGRTFNLNNSDLESPLLYAEPLSMAIVPLNNNNTDKCPLGQKMKFVIELALRTIGEYQDQVPNIVDLSPELLCQYSSKSTQNDIDWVISCTGRDKITLSAEKGKTKFSLLDRISGWTVRLRPRVNGKLDASFWHVHPLKTRTFRSSIEVIHYIFYEDKPKPQQRAKRKIEDVPSTSTFEKRSRARPPESLQDFNEEGCKRLYDLAVVAASQLVSSTRFNEYTPKKGFFTLEPPDTLQDIVNGGKVVWH